MWCMCFLPLTAPPPTHTHTVCILLHFMSEDQAYYMVQSFMYHEKFALFTSFDASFFSPALLLLLHDSSVPDTALYELITDKLHVVCNILIDIQ